MNEWKEINDNIDLFYGDWCWIALNNGQVSLTYYLYNVDDKIFVSILNGDVIDISRVIYYMKYKAPEHPNKTNDG